jgi:hypothetical protein
MRLSSLSNHMNTQVECLHRPHEEVDHHDGQEDLEEGSEEDSKEDDYHPYESKDGNSSFSNSELSNISTTCTSNHSNNNNLQHHP